MPTCIFILARFTLRVDNVLFRIHDTRIYHSFHSSPPLVIRQASGWEAPYDRVKRVRVLSMMHSACVLICTLILQQLHKRDDLTPLTDPTFIAKVLTDMPSQASQEIGASTGWRGLGSKVEIAVLQKPE